MLKITEEEKQDLYLLFNYYLLFKRSNALDPKAEVYRGERKEAVERIREGLEALIGLRNLEGFGARVRKAELKAELEKEFEELFIKRKRGAP